VALDASVPDRSFDRRLWNPARRSVLRVGLSVSRLGLDRELAAGVDPRSRPLLALRAEQLVRRRYRRRLAGAVERLIDELDANRGWWLSAAVPFLRDQVAEARPTLLALARALRSEQPIEPRGVALLSNLLTDTESPLYTRTARGALQLKAHVALEYMVGAHLQWHDFELVTAPLLHGGPDGHH
jgi:hypothetical protein